MIWKTSMHELVVDLTPIKALHEQVWHCSMDVTALKAEELKPATSGSSCSKQKEHPQFQKLFERETWMVPLHISDRPFNNTWKAILPLNEGFGKGVVAVSISQYSACLTTAH